MSLQQLIQRHHQPQRHHQSHRQVLWVLSVAITAGLTLASCGSSATIEARVDLQAAPDDLASTSTSAELPGTEEFGLTETELVAAVDAVETRIAACMNDAGFDYVAADYTAVRDAMDAIGSAPGLSEQEYAAQFGYGISTQFDNPAAGIGFGPANQTIIEGLSSTDRSAYEFKLLGESTESTFAIALDDEDFSEVDGCTGAAIEEVFDQAQLASEYINPKDVLVEQDPRVIAANGDWRECMTSKGYDFDVPDDAEEGIVDRFDELLDEWELEELMANPGGVLSEFQGEERAIATVDRACDDEFVDPVVAAVEIEVFGEET